MIRKLIYTAMALLLAAGSTSCSDDKTEEPKREQKPVLRTDRSSIVADGRQSATFTVFSGENDVTEAATITCAEVEEFSGVSFTTTEAGSYTFTATYNGATSDVLTITATAAETDDAMFSIELYDLYATGVTMRVTPKENGRGYYFDILTEENFTYYTEHGWQELIDYTVHGIANDYGMSAEEAVEAITSLGPDEWTFKTLTNDTAYHAVVIPIDTAGDVNAEIVEEPFATPKVEGSDNTFSITVGNAGHDGADFTVTPSSDDPYFVNIVSKAVADEFHTEDELTAYCTGTVPVVDEFVQSGKYNLANQHFCQPGRDFYVVVFGYDAGVVTTPVSKAEFSTTTDGDPASCTFRFETGTVTHNTAEVAVTPSNQYNVFFWEAIATEDLEFFRELYAEEEGITDLQDVMAMYWQTEVLEVMCDETDMTAAQFVDMAALWGGAVGGTDLSTLTFLDEQTEYVAWAVTIDAYGQPVGEFMFSEPFTTSKEVVSPARADIRIVGCFNGDELTGEWHTENNAVVVMEITPSADAVEWYSDFYAGDVSYSDRYNLIKNLTEYSGNYCPEILIRTTPWEYYCSAISVAKDAAGNFGEVSCEVDLFYRSKARPAEEFEQYASKAEPHAYRPMVLKPDTGRERPEVKLHRTITPRR